MVLNLVADLARKADSHSRRALRPLHVSGGHFCLRVGPSYFRGKSNSPASCTLHGSINRLYKNNQWATFTRFCPQNGHRALPATEGTVRLYIGHLFKYDRFHGRSVERYVSAIRTRHAREEMTDPFASGHHIDLLRAFRHQNDQREEL